MDPTGRDLDRNFNHMSVSFDNLTFKQKIEVTLNGQDLILNLIVLTDGCSRIVRVSKNEMNREQEDKIV